MEKNISPKYKEEIEDLREEEDFEQLGDEKYMEHADREARLLWAFYRPSGSHPKQISDEDPEVAIMAFNHSRLPALERFTRLNPQVIEKESLRNKIRNRTRMLFRDLVDRDFIELNDVLNLVPVFTPVSVDQLINGRKWTEIKADIDAASRFLIRTKEYHNDKFLSAFYRKLPTFEDLTISEVKEFLSHLTSSHDALIRDFYAKKMQSYCKKNGVHLLQIKALENILNKLSLTN